MAPFRSIEPAPPLNAEDQVLWDVVEEHLDEAEFCFELFESQLDHPTLTLADLAKGAEARLLAHVDALVVGGPPVAERLLAPQIAAPGPDELARVTAAALALVAGGHVERVSPALFHEHHAVRNAAVRACSLLADARVDRWMLGHLTQATSAHQLQALLDFAALRGFEPPDLFATLQSAEPQLAAAAARASRAGQARVYLAPLETLLENADPLVRHAALVAALAGGSTRAWEACERWALDQTNPDAHAMALYAALGRPAHHALLQRQLEHPKHRCHTLFALGFSGNAALIPLLLEHLHSNQIREAKLAAQAISTITGLDLEADELSAPPSDSDARGGEELLPLGEDLSSDLSLPPEDALPSPNVAAIVRWWQAASSTFRSERRYLGGQAYGPDAILDYLERAPLRRRHVLGVALGITTGTWLDTRGFSETQRTSLASLRASQPRFTR